MSAGARAMSPSGVPAPADKRFRRADTRGSRRGSGWLRARIAIGIVAVVALLAAVAAAGSYLAHLGFFTVSRVAVRGNARLSTGEVLTLVDGLKGESVFAVDLDAYRTRLLQSPWVADATLRRVLPSTIDLKIVERAPIAIGRVAEQLFLIDASGVVIDEYGPQYAQYDLPIVDGLTVATSGKTTKSTGSDDGPGGASVDPARAALAAQFMEALAATPALKQRVSQIDVSDVHNVIAILDRDPVSLRLGDRDFAARLQRYVELAPTLKDTIQEIDAVDLRFDERIPVSRKDKGKL